MVANEPKTTVPPPISKLIRPFALVLTVWVSEYTVKLPCIMDIFIPTEVEVTRTPPLFLITAW